MGDLKPNNPMEEVPSHDQLHCLAKVGDTDGVRAYLASLEADKCMYHLGLQDDNGELASHCAVRAGHEDILQLVLPIHLINAKSNKGRSVLHLAAAYGHPKLVKGLLEFTPQSVESAPQSAHVNLESTSQSADVNLRDDAGNTPLHLAVLFDHKDVAALLLKAGASVCALNNEQMMPVSYCKDPAMFETLVFNHVSGHASRPAVQTCQMVDADHKSLLHYAAHFLTDRDAIAKLISEMNPDQLQLKDTLGDNFLHVAAKAGNLQVLQALKKLGPVRIDIARLMSSDGGNQLHNNPGLLALLHNHREFFDELLAMGKVEITLGCIIKELLAELIDSEDIQSRLTLFASTLPTYLALFANKHCVFDFLLETTLLSIGQYDDEYKRTCMHWAVIHKRKDIVEKLCKNTHLGPGMEDGDGKTAMQYAFDQKNHEIMEILRGKPGFKDHEEKLQRDREVYVQALNAILVGAALIASVAYAGWLQLPFNAEFKTLGLKIYWASNSISFYTAVAAMCVTITALIPTPKKYVGNIVYQLKLAIVLDATLLALSIAAVTWAFAAAGFAALRHSHIPQYEWLMRGTTAVGGCLCVVMWVGFVLQLYQSGPSFKDVLLTLPPSVLHFKPLIQRTAFQIRQAHVGESSRLGYPTKLRREISELMDVDLIDAYRARHYPPNADTSDLTITDVPTITNLLSKLEISGKEAFIKSLSEKKKKKITSKEQKEMGISAIKSEFNVSSG